MTSARRRSDSGLTLVEVLVAITLLAVAGAILGVATIGGLQASRRAQARTVSLAQYQTALERVSRGLRVADPMEMVSSSDVQLRTFGSSQCQRLRYRLEGSDLVGYRQAGLAPTPPPVTQPRTTGVCSTPPAALSTMQRTVLATGLDPGAAPFSFLDATLMPFTPTDPAQVAAVGITLRAAGTGAGTPHAVTTRVYVRNGPLAP